MSLRRCVDHSIRVWHSRQQHTCLQAFDHNDGASQPDCCKWPGALANVSNPAGVTHVQGPYYRAMEGAGDCVAASIGGAVKGYLNNQEATDGATMVGSTGTTSLITGGLESSGTDLATEISEMITTQRGYQANTRIITVTDSMLEELVNMKR